MSASERKPFRRQGQGARCFLSSDGETEAMGLAPDLTKVPDGNLDPGAAAKKNRVLPHSAKTHRGATWPQ